MAGKSVGVLALQGGFAAHASILRELGAHVREIRVPEELDPVDALVLPGGESTTMMLGIEREGLKEPLAAFVESGRPVMATCAGAIILDDAHLGLLDIACDRNAYGSQIKSFEADLSIDEGDSFPGVFIRAPRITRCGVEVLSEWNDEPVLVREGNVLAMTFHPELTSDDRIHRMFLETVPHSNVTDLKRRAA